jgi:ribosomal protein S18 acetylase RimI-like enzyme
VPSYFREATSTRDEWIRLLSATHTQVLVAAGDGDGPRVIGSVWLRVVDTPDSPLMVPRRRAHVEALIVDRRHRRAGVGTALMDAAAAWAAGRGAVEMVLTVWTGNDGAEAFYRRLGYGVLSRVLSKMI